MSDLERQLEELFMSDSRSRRVDQVNVPAPRRSRFGGPVFVGGVAMAALALIVAFSLLRGGPENVPASSPPPSGSAGVVASPNPSVSAVPGEQVMCGQVSLFNAPTSTVSGSFVITPSGATGNYIVIPAGGQMSAASGYTCVRVKNLPQGAPSVVFVSVLTPGMDGYVAEGAATSAAPSATSGARPDAQHGVITRGGSGGVMRTEAGSAALTTLKTYRGLAVTKDGRRVAYVLVGATGEQLVVFDTAKPDVQKTLMDFPGGVETAGGLVWSSDGNDEVLIQVDMRSQSDPLAVDFSSLRAVNADTGASREIVRTTTALLLPIVWHASTNTGGAVETGGGGHAISYDYISGGALKRSPFPQGEIGAFSIRSDADGKRVLALGALGAPRGVLWWPFDKFEEKRDLKATDGWDVSAAFWRAGTDEIVVFASPTVKGAPGPAPRIEAWTTSDQRRTVAESTGPLATVRVDGSAAITTSWMLVDLRSGAATEIPGADGNQTPLWAVGFR